MGTGRGELRLLGGRISLGMAWRYDRVHSVWRSAEVPWDPKFWPVLRNQAAEVGQ